MGEAPTGRAGRGPYFRLRYGHRRRRCPPPAGTSCSDGGSGGLGGGGRGALPGGNGGAPGDGGLNGGTGGAGGGDDLDGCRNDAHWLIAELLPNRRCRPLSANLMSICPRACNRWSMGWSEAFGYRKCASKQARLLGGFCASWGSYGCDTRKPCFLDRQC